jgi:hypothetical protein
MTTPASASGFFFAGDAAAFGCCRLVLPLGACCDAPAADADALPPPPPRAAFDRVRCVRDWSCISCIMPDMIAADESFRLIRGVAGTPELGCEIYFCVLTCFCRVYRAH